MPSLLRSFLAVLGGLLVMTVTVFLLLIVAVNLTHSTAAAITPAQLALNVLCALLAGVAGGMTSTRFAPVHPFRHGLVLALVILVMGVLSFLRPVPQVLEQPMIYRLLMVAASPVGAVLGAILMERIRALRKRA